MDRSNVPQQPDTIEVTLREYEPHRVIDKDGMIGRPRKPANPGPAGVVFLTSIRDVGAEDMNGEVVTGLIEAVNRAINEEVLDLGNYMRIRGIITDDKASDYLHPYPLTPRWGKSWIHSLDSRNDKGTLLTDITEHIPSTFRQTEGKTPKKVKEERAQFEQKVYDTSKQMGADIVVSDHLMVRLIHLIKTNRYSIGRVLNIHPGISDPSNPHRLPGSTPTRDAIDRAIDGYILDKKSGLYVPSGPGRRRFRTGASLHIVDEGLDNGPVIADSESTPVYPTDTTMALRKRNYPVKIIVFIVGIIHYVTTMLYRVDQLNFGSGERLTGKRVVSIKRN